MASGTSTGSEQNSESASTRGIRARHAATFALLESGNIQYIVYTGALFDRTLDDYIALHRKALTLGIVCLTSLDTANALADVIAGRFREDNTELVDILDMRTEPMKLPFAKMQGSGNDYIFFENFDGKITCPEALAVSLCDRSRGIGGSGIVLIEKSEIADAKMRIFNQDGSEGKMAGNSIRCTGKYLYDNGYVHSERITVETASGIKTLTMYTSGGKVTYVSVEMGKPDFSAKSLPCTLNADEIIRYPVTVGGKEYEITCLSVGNPHCVIFCEHVNDIHIEMIGPLFEHASFFPERINTEFIHIADETTIQMRVWERGNGETQACGTGAAAAAAAAVRLGLCKKDTDITVKLRDADLVVRCSDEGITLDGDANLVYEGVVEY